MASKKILQLDYDKIEKRIFSIHDQKVIFDFDLAQLYEVETRVLKQAVKRNINRFPEDFMIKLCKDEWKELVTNCDKLPESAKHNPSPPFAFTEYGIVMLSSVLRSQKAVGINIQITRAFIKLRKIATSHEKISQKISELEKAVKSNTGDIKFIFQTLNSMLKTIPKKKSRIGFKPDEN